MADFAKLTISSQNLRKGGKHLQSKHNKSRSLKSKIIASAIAAVLVVSSAVPAITTGLGSANAASVDDEATGATDVTTIGNTQDNIVWTNATYFDYLTDDEKSGGYLTGIKKYGTGFNGSIDEWYPYYGFNNKIKDIANSNSAWSKPLYFGNFCNTSGAYNTSPHHVGSVWPSGYNEAVDQTTRFDYAANNSNGLSNMNQSYQGLMQSTLDANGNLMATSTLKAPYFDEAQLGDYAKVFKSRFPFRSYEENGVTKYEFDSTGAKDNVYFTWSGTTPTKVNYGAGTSYGVKDGIDYFMNPADGQSSGYGIFPFNNRSVGKTVGTRYIYLSKDNTGWGDTYCYFFNSSGTVGNAWPGSKMSTYSGGGSNVRIAIPNGATSCIFNNNNNDKTGDITDITYGAYWLGNDKSVHNWDSKPSDAGTTVSENLDFGFGIKTEMNFRVPKGGVDKAGNDIKFTYSGDDDLWVYITDTTTNTSQLVLDLGGNHKQATGEINFKTMKSTANDVYGRGKVTTGFTYDYSKTYKMSIFYMERGMLESNCKMTFTMVPLGNNVIVTEKIDTAYVNAGIKDAVTAASKFGFDVYDGSTVKSSFDLGNGDTATETKCTTGNNVHVVQTHPDTGLKYTTSYDIYNTANKSGTIQSGTTTTSPDIRLINPSDDTYDFAEVEADFVNTPALADVKITKKVNGLNEGETDNTDFNGTVEVSLDGGTTWGKYPLQYKFGGNTYTLTSAGELASNAQLRNGRTLEFANLPQGAKVRFTEGDTDEEHSFVSVTGDSDGITVGASGNLITVTNQKNRPDQVTVTLEAKKNLTGADLVNGQFNFELLNSSRSVIQTKPCDNDGSIKFDSFTYSAAANETYYIREKIPATQDSDIKSYDTTEYRVSVVVTKSGLNLNPTVTYYKNSTVVSNAEFTNVVKRGEVYIVKEDNAGNDVTGVQFGIYAVRINGESLAGKAPIQTARTETMSVPYTDGAKQKTAVHFSDLALYSDNIYYADENDKSYQVYAIAEIDPGTGYFKNNTVHYFTLPISGSYAPKFEYVNGHILSPNTGFAGMAGIKMIGIYAICFASLLGAAYVLYTKRNAKKARHRAKK